MQLILWTVIVIGSVILDQWTKHLAVVHLMPIGSTAVVDGIFGLRYVENTGAAFGMMKGQRWFFIILSTVAIVAIAAYLIAKRKTVPPLLGIAMAMIVGGGIGNQIDRILNGYVVDFLEFLFIDFAVFNVADCFVTVGAFLAVFDLLFIDRKYFLGEPSKESAPLAETDNIAPSAEPTDTAPCSEPAEASVDTDGSDSSSPPSNGESGEENL